MSFSTSSFVVNTPFSFSYTLSQGDYNRTMRAYPAGFFYVSLLVNGIQTNIGNGTNDQYDYANQNVQYSPTLQFPNRSYDIAGTYSFRLHFNIGPSNYWQQEPPLFETNITFNNRPLISNICFLAGVPITTNQGNIPIEQINPDVHTIRNKKIIGITQTITQDKHLVCFEKDAFGPNIPSHKTIISKNHNIFYNGKMTKAKQFVGLNDKIYNIKYNGEVLYNVLMEESDKMVVNNLICETLNPENGIAKAYKFIKNLSSKEQNDFINSYNEYVIKNKTFTSKKVTK